MAALGGMLLSPARQTLPQTAQQEQPFTLSVQAQVVTVPVTVRDGKGRLLDGLTKQDFTLLEDGVPQRIRYLSVDHDRPLVVGLLVDTSGSQKEFISKERTAASQFLASMLVRPEDTAFLIRFDNAISLLAKPTSARDDLAAALGHLEDTHAPRLEHPGGTLLYDALDLTCERVTRGVEGRNALVVLTDGRDSGSQLTLDAAIQAAQVSNTVIYSILYTNEQPGWLAGRDPGQLRGKEVLTRLSEATGGRMYQVTFRQGLDRIFSAIAEEMRMQYVLGYTPANHGPGYGFRKIEIKGRDTTWKVQTRTGYFYSGAEDAGGE
ncbi:MAG: VWA domain-containing protein [Acidobacteriota bacterium]|nr:VWA domain-containing protein [Acidobacteriota bacterium]